MSKLIFNIKEIPEGESERELKLDKNDLDLSSYSFEGGTISIQFYRSLEFIKADYQVQADVELVCDRCLEPFIHPVSTSYEVIFKTDVQEESETETEAMRKFNFEANTFSIEKEVRDSVMLEIPMRQIHPKYFDEQGELKDFESQSFGSEDAEEEPATPDWKKKLKQLKNKS